VRTGEALHRPSSFDGQEVSDSSHNLDGWRARSVDWTPNARPELLPEAGATQERTLEAVRCSALFGVVTLPVCPLGLRTALPRSWAYAGRSKTAMARTTRPSA
jgi:hypothetical protein